MTDKNLIDFEFDKNINGTGWHEQESIENKNFRWTGSETISNIDFLMKKKEDLQIQFRIIKEVIPNNLKNIKVNGTEISYRLLHHNKNGKIIEGFIPKNLIDSTLNIHITFETFETTEIFSKQLERTLKSGIAIDRIIISPTSKRFKIDDWLDFDEKIKLLITQTYQKVLQRNPDDEGLEYHYKLIKENKLNVSELENFFKQSEEYKKRNIENEPEHIFVSFLHNENKEGGLYYLKDNLFQPVFEGTTCHGIFFDSNTKILFFVTRIDPQIIAFKIEKNGFVKIPIKFQNYLFANNAHGICVKDNKLYVIATDGEPNGQLASNIAGAGKHVGKIIVSELNFSENHIEIKSSKSYNPFGCSHHHHINDITIFNNEFYVSSFSFCNKKNVYIPNGAIFKWTPESFPELLISNLDHPHTLSVFDKKIFFCSSRASSIFSFFPNSNDSPKLEYKGANSFVRGLLITQNYIYFGLSESMGRTDFQFHNKICALLQFNRRTGETKSFPCPSNCNNLYAIGSSTSYKL